MDSQIDRGFFKRLESDLSVLEAQTHTTPYIAYSKIVRVLDGYNIHLDKEDTFVAFDDVDEADYFFQLTYPNSNENENMYLTLSFDKDEDEMFYHVDINIVTEEELNEFIGDDEVEDI